MIPSGLPTFFRVQNSMTKGGIRSDEADELAGLDVPEMGVPAYPDFVHVSHDPSPAGVALHPATAAAAGTAPTRGEVVP